MPCAIVFVVRLLALPRLGGAGVFRFAAWTAVLTSSGTGNLAAVLGTYTKFDYLIKGYTSYNIVTCQRVGVSNQPPWLRAATRHGASDPLVHLWTDQRIPGPVSQVVAARAVCWRPRLAGMRQYIKRLGREEVKVTSAQYINYLLMIKN